MDYLWSEPPGNHYGSPRFTLCLREFIHLLTFLCPAHSWYYTLLESHSTLLTLSVGVSEAAAVRHSPGQQAALVGSTEASCQGLPRGHMSSP